MRNLGEEKESFADWRRGRGEGDDRLGSSKKKRRSKGLPRAFSAKNPVNSTRRGRRRKKRRDCPGGRNVEGELDISAKLNSVLEVRGGI